MTKIVVLVIAVLLNGKITVTTVDTESVDACVATGNILISQIKENEPTADIKAACVEADFNE